MSVDAREAALIVDRVAAGVAGVTRVYPVGPVAARAARQALGSPVPLSEVRATDAETVVDVCVGIEGDAAAIGAEVSRAVRRALAEAGPVTVRVRISRVR